jgi:FkbM family methyltransferase
MKRARVDTPPPRPKLLEDGAGITFEYINEAEAELIYNEIVVSGCYAKHGIELTPGAFVVDGGANLGLFSLWCALQAPTLRILAFEPLPPIATILRRNLRSNFEAQATLLDPVFEIREEALGRETASGVPFTYYPTSPGESTRHPDERLGTLRRVAEVAKEAYLQAVARAAKDEKAGKASDESDSESTNTWIDALKDISNQAELELRAATDSEAQTFPCGKPSLCIQL